MQCTVYTIACFIETSFWKFLEMTVTGFFSRNKFQTNFVNNVSWTDKQHKKFTVETTHPPTTAYIYISKGIFFIMSKINCHNCRQTCIICIPHISFLQHLQELSNYLDQLLLASHPAAQFGVYFLQLLSVFEDIIREI
jgi:hypothetical protein